MNKWDYPGSRWWKFDFHNHTPASSDYDQDEISTLQPREWLLAYMRKEIDCVAVTDHNTAAWVGQLQVVLDEMSRETPKEDGYRPLTLFPGVEITTSDSLHILAIFDPNTTKEKIDGLLHGKLHASNAGALSAEIMFSESASTVIDHIHELGGLAIGAHVEKESGLLYGRLENSVEQSESSEPVTKFKPKNSGRMLEDILGKIDALEFQTIDCESLRHFDKNKVIQRLAKISGSDAPHSTSNAGTRFSWIKMSKPSFEGLRLALMDPEAAVIRSEKSFLNPSVFPGHWIESITLANMHLRRKHLDPLTLAFNPAYNAIIGGRGSGKSTVLECIRLAMGRGFELEQLGKDSDIWKSFESFKKEYKDHGMMLSDTRISVITVIGKGKTAQRFQLVWSKENGQFAPRVSRWNGDAWQATDLPISDVASYFPIKIFSQKQILALANDPQALLMQIDNSISEQKKQWQQEFDACKTNLLAARLRVRTLKKELAKKPALELEYQEASRKASIFAKSNFAPLLKQYQRATQQQRALDDFYHLLATDISTLQAAIKQVENLGNTELSQFLTETDAEIAARNHALSTKEQLSQRYQKIAAQVHDMQVLLGNALFAHQASDWHRENTTAIDAYQTETARLKSAGMNTAQEAGAAVVVEEKLRKQLEQLRIFESELLQAEESVKLAAQALSDCRKNLTTIRARFVSTLLEQNDTLKVSLRGMSAISNEVNRFGDILRIGSGDTFASSIWQVQDEDGEEKKCGMLADVIEQDGSLVPENLAKLKHSLEYVTLKNHDGKILNTKLRVDFLSRIEKLSPEVYDELAYWFPEDEVQLEYRPRKGDRYKDIRQASAGQKTAAMLSFLLLHGDEPLILDQPEDDLDNAIVSELVVEQLRNNKNHRQLIVVTHNANIVVNADADLVITMSFNGQIDSSSSGGMQETVVREDICRVMEGGEQAFRQRYKRILEDLEMKHDVRG
jgi:DNA repair ATPase RecN